MKFNFFSSKSKRSVKTISDYKQDVLVKQGREQFKKLLEKGISIPVVLLLTPLSGAEDKKRASLSLLELISPCTISNALGKRVISP